MKIRKKIRKKIGAIGLISIFSIQSLSVFAVDAESETKARWSEYSYSERITELKEAQQQIASERIVLEEEIASYEERVTLVESELRNAERLQKERIEAVTTVGAKRTELQQLEQILNSTHSGEIAKSNQTRITREVGRDESAKALEQHVLMQKTRLDTVQSQLKSRQAELSQLQLPESDVIELDTLEQKILKQEGEIQFDADNLLTVSNVGVAEMTKALAGTALEPLAEVYVEAEREFGLNAFFLAGLSAQESGWGTSRRAVEDNNLTGFGAYDDGAEGINGKTKRDNLLETASWVVENYLTPGAPYFHGYSIRSVNTRYCIGYDGKTDFNWSVHISRIANELVEKSKK